ncbi:hypothetical protein COLSTE_00007 [Collinsella stercoris DSM 13279]|uniref:Lipoprotein n=1 Tax=Collinsella stercoris DSM 13279 TaxID=445975 RepID=B6G7G8_9ACTN|nr:hypothetical protein COLSTE_00007 [Collinsella stercoris DSM 13279]
MLVCPRLAVRLWLAVLCWLIALSACRLIEPSRTSSVRFSNV